MARVLLVGCGCRGRALAAALLAGGHAMRGTTRDAGSLEAIEATGAHAVRADPDRLATLTPHIAGISVLCWLMGTARGEPEEVAGLHGPRLQSMLETLVDTPVRGLVYEAAGSVERAWLERGAASVRGAGETYRMPVQVVDRDPSDHPSWVADMTRAVERVLSA